MGFRIVQRYKTRRTSTQYSHAFLRLFVYHASATASPICCVYVLPCCKSVYNAVPGGVDVQKIRSPYEVPYVGVLDRKRPPRPGVAGTAELKSGPYTLNSLGGVSRA